MMEINNMGLEEKLREALGVKRTRRNDFKVITKILKEALIRYEIESPNGLTPTLRIQDHILFDFDDNGKLIGCDVHLQWLDNLIEAYNEKIKKEK